MRYMTQTVLDSINNKISLLQTEARTLRSFVIGVLGRDQEGEYKPSFIKSVLRSASKAGNIVFRNKKSFLKKLRG